MTLVFPTQTWRWGRNGDAPEGWNEITHVTSFIQSGPGDEACPGDTTVVRKSHRSVPEDRRCQFGQTIESRRGGHYGTRPDGSWGYVALPQLQVTLQHEHCPRRAVVTVLPEGYDAPCRACTYCVVRLVRALIRKEGLALSISPLEPESKRRGVASRKEIVIDSGDEKQDRVLGLILNARVRGAKRSLASSGSSFRGI